MSQSRANGRGNRWLLGAAAVLGLVLIAPQAAAHFTLMEPANWESQDSLGSPQKLGPCGDEGGGTPTGTVTAYQTGQTITIRINETIFHPGHYRISLAVHDRSEIPAEPIVTPGSTACGSAPIMSPPVFPVLADGVLAHSARFTSPQTVQVTLPAGVTCDHCTLQVLEFMSQHPLNNPGGCFYHHCADISIHDVVVTDAGMSVDTGMSIDTGTSMDAGVGSGMDGGGAPPTTHGACACSVPGEGASPRWSILAALPLLALIARRARKR